MQANEKSKMASVVHTNYLLLPILKRFGIELGFGDQSIEQVCKEKNIDVHFFLDIIKIYLDENYFPKKHLAGFPSSQIISYLKKTHDYYLKEKVPKIENLIKKLVSTSRAEQQKLKLIENFFSEYKEELVSHIQREEDVVYPYILNLDEIYNSSATGKDLPKSVQAYSIHDFADEHDNMEEKLYDLKSILIKYLPRQEDQTLLHNLLNELFELEKDLYDHSRIEDKVLIPKIAEMEKELKESHSM